MKEFAEDNFEFDENGGAFSKRVENTAGKGEIASTETVLCVRKSCTKKGRSRISLAYFGLCFNKLMLWQKGALCIFVKYDTWIGIA